MKPIGGAIGGALGISAAFSGLLAMLLPDSDGDGSKKSEL